MVHSCPATKRLRLGYRTNEVYKMTNISYQIQSNASIVCPEGALSKTLGKMVRYYKCELRGLTSLLS